MNIRPAGTARRAHASGSARRRRSASAFGLLATVQAFGKLAASAVTGILWTAASPRTAFIYLAGWMLLTLIGLATVTRPTAGNTA